ncbi:DUF1854 domain-containing protein [Candidatus Accumulibacter sp. ACC003]|uniref:cyanophycin metabolism-associated DUF1854 family protein n=1 Tax=Candidatus Accumulibacter sp. ACC003 TaxID=2823334 RepID=UPI0025BBF692|nr:DUF1854 domain-containing protein [Candidatus Accumulibacter sp. ACC003]
MNATPDYRLRRNAFGRLELSTADGQTHVDVVPVRAFPITAADDGIGLVDPHGKELAWIDRLSDLPDELRTLVEAELAQREFMPEIRRITDVSSFATPSTWHVDTDRGSSRFVLKGEEDIRRLASPALLIADSHGIQFLIRDRYALDQTSRRILDRFL